MTGGPAARWATVDALREVDLPRVAELDEILFQQEGPWTLAMLTGDLKAAHTRYFAARDLTGLVLGYAGVALLGDVAEVVTIGVDPAAQRTGAGRALLGALLYEAEGREVFLEVRVDNVPAINLYEAEGFEKISVRKNYYRRVSKDAVVMRRPASPDGDLQRCSEPRIDSSL